LSDFSNIDLSDKKILEESIGRLSLMLGISVDPKVRDSFFRGEEQALLSYEKLESIKSEVPIISRYLLGVKSYLAQPSLTHYYDIFRAGRIIPLTVALERAISILLQKDIEGLEGRLKRLTSEITFDSFESILFELVVAAKYTSLPRCSVLRFVEENGRLQPDIEATINGEPHFIECKKPDRRNDASIVLRDTVRHKIKSLLSALSVDKSCVVVELTFHVHPAEISDDRIKNLATVSLRTEASLVEPDITISTRRISPKTLKDYALFPSPGYFA